MRWWWCALPALVGCAAAGGDDTDDAETADTTPSTGTLAVRFQIDDDWGDQVAADGESLVGPFWGDLYLSDDVTALGPNEGAEALASMHYEDIDLSSYAPTDVFGTFELPVGWVTALGFFDSDGNADPESPDPDRGDPVTLPNINEFEVVGGETTEVVIKFTFRNL